MIIIYVINLIAFEYHEQNFFHGDIKPENIFFGYIMHTFYMTSDLGSLLYLGE